jgi:hypothetical protein
LVSANATGQATAPVTQLCPAVATVVHKDPESMRMCWKPDISAGWIAELVQPAPLLRKKLPALPEEVIPVPPFRTATTPVTFPAVPEMLALTVLVKVLVPSMDCAVVRSTNPVDVAALV